jgi:aspartate/methionine/tyrosine aminotransferase
MFSARLPAGLAPNALARAVDARRRAGGPLIDLTQTNPTEVGLSYPSDGLRSLADPAGLLYRPDPRGLRDARAAISASYGVGAAVDPDRVILTASTSEAYGLLFKLLCDPGDEVLVPQPGYPLFDLITRLEAVTPRPYRLRADSGWSIDRAGLEAAIGPRTRVVLVVSPNNPTGSILRRDDHEWLATLCRERGLAIVGDEVFADYPLAEPVDGCRLLGENRVLTFVLGGLSKSAGLPQVKLGWTIVSGPEREAAEALERLDVINDTYLSASTPTQVAAPALIARGVVIRDAIHARLHRNLDRLRAAARACPSVTMMEPDGGWSVVLRVPAVRSEEDLVLRLVEDQGVLVHPGFFFDFPHEALVVLSLLPEPAVFDEGIGRIWRVLDEVLV